MMVRESRHLWIENLPEDTNESDLQHYLEQFGRVQSVRLIKSLGGAEPSGVPASLTSVTADGNTVISTTVNGFPVSKNQINTNASVAFIDIRSACKAHTNRLMLGGHVLVTNYHEGALNKSPSSGKNDITPLDVSPTGHNAVNNDLSSSNSNDKNQLNKSLSENIQSVLHSPRASSATQSRHSSGGDAKENEPLVCDANLGVEHSVVSVLSGQDGSFESKSSSQASINQSLSSCNASTHSSSASSGNSASSSRNSSPDSQNENSRHNGGTTIITNDTRPVCLRIRNLPARSSDSSLKDGLYHEFKKYGKVTAVKVEGSGGDRRGIICFKRPEDVDKALLLSDGRNFFGIPIRVDVYRNPVELDDSDYRIVEQELDEYHSKASRTLFVGNLDSSTTIADVRELCKSFGGIIDIDVKLPKNEANPYAFVQFASISSVVRALRKLDGYVRNGNRIKIGFGKSMSSNCVWCDNLATSATEKQLRVKFARHGLVRYCIKNQQLGQALVFFEGPEFAQNSIQELRGAVVAGRKLQLDFAGKEFQAKFFEEMETSGQLENPAHRRFSHEISADILQPQATTPNATVTANNSVSLSLRTRSQHTTVRNANAVGSVPNRLAREIRDSSLERLSSDGSSDELPVHFPTRTRRSSASQSTESSSQEVARVIPCEAVPISVRQIRRQTLSSSRSPSPSGLFINGNHHSRSTEIVSPDSNLPARKRRISALHSPNGSRNSSPEASCPVVLEKENGVRRNEIKDNANSNGNSTQANINATDVKEPIRAKSPNDILLTKKRTPSNNKSSESSGSKVNKNLTKTAEKKGNEKTGTKETKNVSNSKVELPSWYDERRFKLLNTGLGLLSEADLKMALFQSRMADFRLRSISETLRPEQYGYTTAPGACQALNETNPIVTPSTQNDDTGKSPPPSPTHKAEKATAVTSAPVTQPPSSSAVPCDKPSDNKSLDVPIVKTLELGTEISSTKLVANTETPKTILPEAKSSPSFSAAAATVVAAALGSTTISSSINKVGESSTETNKNSDVGQAEAFVSTTPNADGSARPPSIEQRLKALDEQIFRLSGSCNDFLLKKKRHGKSVAFGDDGDDETDDGGKHYETISEPATPVVFKASITPIFQPTVVPSAQATKEIDELQSARESITSASLFSRAKSLIAPPIAAVVPSSSSSSVSETFSSISIPKSAPLTSNVAKEVANAPPITSAAPVPVIHPHIKGALHPPLLDKSTKVDTKQEAIPVAEIHQEREKPQKIDVNIPLAISVTYSSTTTSSSNASISAPSTPSPNKDPSPLTKQCSGLSLLAANIRSGSVGISEAKTSSIPTFNKQPSFSGKSLSDSKDVSLPGTPTLPKIPIHPKLKTDPYAKPIKAEPISLLKVKEEPHDTKSPNLTRLSPTSRRPFQKSISIANPNSSTPATPIVLTPAPLSAGFLLKKPAKHRSSTVKSLFALDPHARVKRGQRQKSDTGEDEDGSSDEFEFSAPQSEPQDEKLDWIEKQDTQTSKNNTDEVVRKEKEKGQVASASAALDFSEESDDNWELNLSKCMEKPKRKHIRDSETSKLASVVGNGKVKEDSDSPAAASSSDVGHFGKAKEKSSTKSSVTSSSSSKSSLTKKKHVKAEKFSKSKKSTRATISDDSSDSDSSSAHSHHRTKHRLSKASSVCSSVKQSSHAKKAVTPSSASSSSSESDREKKPKRPGRPSNKSKHSEKTKIKTSPHRTSISKSRSTTPSTTSNETSRSKTTNTFSSENKSTSSGIDAATAAAIKRSIFEVEPVDLFSSMYDRIKRKAAIPKSVTAPTTSRSRKDRSGSSPDDRSSSHKSSDRRSSKKKDRSKSDSKGRRRRKRRESSDDEDVRRFDSSSAEESGHSDAEKKKKKSLKQARSGTKESDSMKKSGFIIAKQRRRRSKKKEVRMQSSSGDEFDVVKSSSDEDDKRSSTSKYLKASKQDEKRKRKVKHSKTSPTHSVRNSLEKCNRGLESFIKDSRRSSSKPVDDNFEIPDDTPFSLDWNSELPTKSSSASGVRRNKTPSRSNSRQRSSHRNMSDDDDDMRSISRATSSEMSVPLSLAKKEKRASKDRTSSPCTDNQRDEDMKATDMLEELMSDHREVRGKQQDGVAGVSNIGKSSMPGRAVSSSSRQNVVLASGTVARKSYPSPPELIPEISRGLKSQTLTTNASSKAAVPTTKEKPIVAKKPTAPEPPKLQAQIARDVTKDSERKRKEIVGSESCEPAAKSIALSSSAKQSATKATGSFRSASGQQASAPLASFIPAPVITVNDDVPLMTPISGASSANVKLETEAWKNVVSGGLISNEQKPLNFIRGTAPVLVKHDIKPEVPCATTSRPIGLIQAPKIANVTSITDKNPISHTRPIAHAVVAGTNVRPAPIQPLRVPVNLTSLANLNLSTCHTAYIAATQANAANVASNAMGIAYSPYASTIVVPSSGTKLATSTANVSKSGGLVSGSVPLTIDTALPSMKMNAPLGTAADYRATGFMPGNSPLVGGQIKTTGVWDPSTQSPRGQSISATGLSPGGWPAHSQQQLPSNWNLHNAAPAQASNHASPLLNNESLLNTQASPPAFLQQFPTAWTGYLSIKNDQALVRMFFVSGNGQLTKVLGPASTLKHNSLPLLKMVQRMRLDPTQLQMVEKRAQMANGHCMLIACATGRCEAESSKQGAALESGFITYLQQKQACGIVSVNGGAPHPFQSTIHIFPPCEWSHRTLNRVAPQLATFMATTPHLFLLITSEV